MNLRLTAQEHEDLLARARDGRRSLQRQIVFELFNGGLSEGAGSALDGGLASGTRAPLADPVMAPSESRPVTGRPQSSDTPRKAYAKDCRNADYHWKGPCKYCGGGEPA